MSRLSALFLVGLCFCAAPALSYWQSRTQISISVAPSYTGPGDVVTGAIGWWGLRAYNAAYAAGLSKIANVCTALDAVCADVNSDTNGNFNLSGTGALVCNNIGSICTIKTLYDQSGNGNDITQATSGSRFTLVTACLNGLVCYSNVGTVDGSQRLSVSSLSATQAQPFTASVVWNVASGSGGISTLMFSNGQNVQVLGDTNGKVTLYAGSLPSSVGTVANNAFHAGQFLGNGASSSIYVDGTSLALSGSIGGSSLTLQTGVGANGNTCLCKGTEGGFWAGNFSAPQQASMNANQTTYWGPF